MTERACIDCGETFEADEPWKARCLPCWKRTKRLQDTGGYWTPVEARDLSRRLADAHRTITDLERALRQRSANSELDPDMLRTLVQLCHPDKHGDSEASRRATQFLLDLKRRSTA